MTQNSLYAEEYTRDDYSFYIGEIVSVTIQFCSYSTKHNQPSWFVRKTPMRLNNRKLKIEYPTPIQRLLSNDNWLELDSDFEQGATEQGKIVKFKSLHGKRRFAIVEFEDGAVTRVHRVSFEVANFSIDDFQVGDSLMVTKLGYMADRHTTKWIVVNPPYHFDEKGALVV